MDDIDRFADLGIKVIRYPLLWERIAPRGLHRADWGWAEARVDRLLQRGVRPIIGLLHHGSGPREGPQKTSLIDPDFPRKFAAYAREVSRRFPMVDRYTPINEPLTIARFSCLYRLWYPHRCSDRSFVAALLNQIEGTQLAMQEIRSINGDAELVQTEDLGEISATPTLAYQARFENERRWLTFDLLIGEVGREHPLRNYLIRSGTSIGRLASIRRRAIPSFTLGINHYVLSNRYLDENRARYPRRYHCGNRRHRYADVETVRVAGVENTTLERLLIETGWRYRRPIAVTEAHIDAPSHEQIRWLSGFWRAALLAQKQGADIRAVTAWSLLGHYHWNALVTRENGYYEPGLFSVIGGEVKETPLANYVRTLAQTGSCDLTKSSDPGWWEREDRFRYASIPHDRWKWRGSLDAPAQQPIKSLRHRVAGIR